MSGHTYIFSRETDKTPHFVSLKHILDLRMESIIPIPLSSIKSCQAQALVIRCVDCLFNTLRTGDADLRF